MQACTWPAVRNGRCLAASSAAGQPSGAAVAQPPAFCVRFVQRVAEPHDAARAAAVRQPKHLHARGQAASGSCNAQGRLPMHLPRTGASDWAYMQEGR